MFGLTYSFVILLVSDFCEKGIFSIITAPLKFIGFAILFACIEPLNQWFINSFGIDNGALTSFLYVCMIVPPIYMFLPIPNYIRHKNNDENDENDNEN